MQVLSWTDSALLTFVRQDKTAVKTDQLVIVVAFTLRTSRA